MAEEPKFCINCDFYGHSPSVPVWHSEYRHTCQSPIEGDSLVTGEEKATQFIPCATARATAFCGPEGARFTKKNLHSCGVCCWLKRRRFCPDCKDGDCWSPETIQA
jgi:hypothetical protein